MKQLYPCQALAVQWLRTAINVHSGALNSSDTGTGKTLMAIELVRSLGCPVFVVCPKVIVTAWRRAFEEQGVPCIGVVNYEKLRTGNTAWVKKSGKKAFKWTLPADTLIVFDEAHKMQAMYSQNSALGITAKQQGFKTLALSATAAEDPSEMRALGYMLGLHNLKDFTSWSLRHGCAFDSWGKLEFTKNRKDADRFLGEIRDQIYPQRAVKLTRHDLSDHFSETTIVTEPLDFGDEKAMRRIYDEVESDLIALAEQSAGDKKGDELNVLTKILRARQKVEILKVPVLVNLVHEYLDEGKSVVVFLNFTASIEAMRKQFPDAPVIQGGQSDIGRQGAIDDFVADRKHVVLVNLAAGGVGVSLHDQIGDRQRVALISPAFDAKTLLQALGRIDRAGTKTPTLQRVLFAAGTIEERVEQILRPKLKNIDTLHKMSNTPPTQMKTEAPVEVNPEVKKDTAHAEYSPSSLKYREVSPMYLPKVGDNQWSLAGTRMHEAAETGDMSKLISDEERAMVDMLLHAVSEIIAEHKFVGHKDAKEIKLDIDLGNGVGTFGTCDRMLVSADETELILIDYKTGKGAIEDANENVQAQAYVLGAFQLFPKAKTAHFYFLVPQRDEILFHTYTRSDAEDIGLRLNTIIARAKSATTCTPQNNVCIYCARQVTCTALADRALKIAGKYSKEGVEVPDEVHAKHVDEPEEMSKLLKLARILDDWAASVRHHANIMAETVNIPGFARICVSGPTTIANASVAQEALKGVVSDEEFKSVTSVDWNALKELVSERSPRGQKAKSVEQVEDLLRDANVLVEGSPRYQLRVKR